MPKFFYHGTTYKAYEDIQKSGAIEPQSGNTYTDKIFLSGNDEYARRVTFVKHAQEQGDIIVVYKIPSYKLKKKYLSDGGKHISSMLSFDDKTWCYSKPISIKDNDVLVGAAPYFLNLPEGVNIYRNDINANVSVNANVNINQ
jgi:hypothetical protein